MANNNGYSPRLPINTEQLEAVTLGKNTFQAELLEIFFFNVAECIELMERACNDGYCEKWQYAAEEIKNVSTSVGAVDLVKISTYAEKKSSADAEEKKQVLASIRSNVHQLRVFIRNTKY